MRRRMQLRERGFALVEVVVILAVIGILLAILLPAVQMARESARKISCQSNLRELALAVKVHHDTHRHFPTDGWGYRWVGDPDRGFGQTQPGGWVYNVLPFIERGDLRGIGSNTIQSIQRDLLAEVAAMPVSLFNCPTRRSTGNYPYSNLAHAQPFNTTRLEQAAKSDYAINGGDVVVSAGPGPGGTTPTELRAYSWPNLQDFNGIAFVRSQIRIAHVLDGVSNTYLIGEKHVNPHDDADAGDDQTMFIGDDADIRRWAVNPPASDRVAVTDRGRFGSAHVDVCFFAFCDGSVRPISYGIDARTHRLLGNREDGEPVQVTTQ